MNVSVLFDVLEERLRSLGASQNAPFPLRVIHFIRRLWNLSQSLFDNRPPPNSICQHDSIFVPQACSWDCGIACCNMVLKWNHGSNVQLFDRHIVASHEKPLWTIELFCLLKEIGINVSMYTNCEGVNPQHRRLSWYANSFENEISATRERFAQAKDNNWNVYEVRTPTFALHSLPHLHFYISICFECHICFECPSVSAN